MEKISTKLINDFRKLKLRKVIDLAEVNAANDKVSQINAGLRKRLELQEYDPSHHVYLLVQNLLSYFSEEISVLDEFEEYYDTLSEMDEEYMPSYPPMSPLTGSYFTLWIFCDFRFGETKETISTIFYDLGTEFKYDKIVTKALSNFNASSMGFYKHMGFDNDLVILKDLVSNKEHHCVCTSGYKGEVDEIWFVRLLPNLDEVYDYQVVFTTPYVIRNYSDKDWTAFFKRQVGSTGDYEAKTHQFFKNHSDIRYWHNYILDAYVDFNSFCIFLTGIPDIKGSKPFELESL